ncbi:F-box/kelch-repeat protein [Raphanus sativus]|uniref:F-box/kelch-repeat protein At5g38670-like n=1 Tax=Raphanus sativus TaxID=3726 RepID=A0A6J0L6G7_RAPSA|nr:F-box/kelch-repeat protein At5g38670-like [Raphanus sativus]KAJ4878689.1 F-box/kelch-repeat protein [Raphanus sativus]
MERLIKRDFVSTRKRKTTITTRTTRREKKKKKLTPNSSSSLPDDLVLMIVARVPRSYYRTLSLVSKSFRSMVASPELYKFRSLLGLTESCLYVCLRIGFSSYKWYTLSSSKSIGGYVLAGVPIPDGGGGVGPGYSDIVAVGSDIYKIGVADKPSLWRWTSGVSILDCKSHTWRKAPSMPVELDELSARFLDGKIYVKGFFYQDGSWKSSLQVFNTNTQTWGLPCYGLDCDGITGEAFAFNSKQCRWDLVEQYPKRGHNIFSNYYREIDNLRCSVSKDGALTWFDTDETRWRDLKGLVGLPKLPSPLAGHGSYVKLKGYSGGKMMVFWNSNLSTHLFQSDTIYCAEIALERRNGDCWGKLEWYDSVLSVPMGTKFIKVLAVTL